MPPSLIHVVTSHVKVASGRCALTWKGPGLPRKSPQSSGSELEPVPLAPSPMLPPNESPLISAFSGCVTCGACVLPIWQLPVYRPCMHVHCRSENVTMNEKERESIPEVPSDQWEINLPKCILDVALLKHKSRLTRQWVTSSLHLFSHSTNS